MGIADEKSILEVQAIFKNKGGLDLKIYKNEFSRTDLYFYKNGVKKDIEVKCRRFDHNKYPTTIIDKTKYDVLVKRNAGLVVLFNDKMAIFPKMEDALIRFTQIYTSKTTDFQDHTKRLDGKAELDLHKAKGYGRK